jgi:uncharacterized membrane protein
MVQTVPRVSRRLPATATNVSFVVAAATTASLLLPATPVSQVVGIVGLMVLTGSLLASLVTTDGSSTVQRITICIGSGFVFFVCFGALLGFVLPHLGVVDPLSRAPLVISWIAVVVAVLASNAQRHRDPVRELLSGIQARHVLWLIVLSLPAVLSLYGAVRLNDGGSPLPAIAAAIVAVALVVLAIALPDDSPGPPRILLLISAFMTCALQGPLRGGWLAGVDTQHEYYVGKLAIAQGVFPLHHYSDPYGGMLSLTVFPAELHSLVGMTLRGVLLFVPSIFLGLALLTTWATVRERLSPRASALLCTLFLIGCQPLLRQLPQVTRQCYALFFFALLVMAVTSKWLPIRTARWLTCMSALGIAVTHYTSAYFAALAVLVGCALSYLYRTERAQRVLTIPVAAVVVGVTALWDAAIAKSQSNVTQLYDAIRKDGLRLLPGKGSIWSRWFHGSPAGAVGNIRRGPVLSALSTLNTAKTSHRHCPPPHTKYSWMVVRRSGCRFTVVPVHTATVSGVHLLGAAVYDLGSALTEIVLLLAVVGVFLCLWKGRRQRTLAGIAGMGLCFLGIAALSRFSGTISVDFGPSRVESQAYLLFIATAAIGLENMQWERLEPLRLRNLDTRRLAIAASVGVAALSISTSSELSNLAVKGAQPPAELASTGQQVQRLLVPDDVLAAGWVAANRTEQGVVQADLYGQLALDEFGFNTRRNFFPVVEPTFADNQAWLFAYRTNIVDKVATRSSSSGVVSAFVFPTTFFTSTRSVLYVSPTDVVFGQVPREIWALVYHPPTSKRATQ